MNSIIKRYKVERKDIAYLRYTIESYDGIAVVATEDASAAVIRLAVSPLCENIVDKLISSFVEDEFLNIQEVY